MQDDILNNEVNKSLKDSYNRIKIQLIGRLCNEVTEDGYNKELSDIIRPFVDGKRV